MSVREKIVENGDSFINKERQHTITRVPIQEIMGKAFKEYMKMDSRRRIIARPPAESQRDEQIRVPPKRGAMSVPAPQPKPRKPRVPKLKPFVLTITLLHTPDQSGNDVLFSKQGDCPSDIDFDDFEQYVGDYFGEENVEEDEFYDEEDE